jgi:hypothetical protein
MSIIDNDILNIEKRIKRILVPIQPDPDFVQSLNKKIHQPSSLPHEDRTGILLDFLLLIIGLFAGSVLVVLFIKWLARRKAND